MRFLFSALSAIFVFSNLASATEFRVQGVGGKVIYRTTVDAVGSVGSVTDSVLSRALLFSAISDYKGSTDGVTSINRMGSASEVISDSVMNAYGWCYTVDGNRPEKMASDYRLSGQEQQITWFYGYAAYDSGRWVAMCAPATHMPSAEDRQ